MADLRVDPNVRPNGARRILSRVAGVAAVALGIFGLLAIASPEPVSAAPVGLAQCNGVSNVGGLTVQCSVSVVNTLTDDPGTTGSVVSINGGPGVASGDIVTSVDQCNGSGNGGGGSVLCSVTIVNNISVAGGVGAGGASVNQCNGSDPGGLGTAPNSCLPFPASTSGATITQCNGSGNGGGLVFPSGCSASGLVSPSLPVTINQCNGSGNGGGGRVVCSASMTTNVIGVPTTTQSATPQIDSAPAL